MHAMNAGDGQPDSELCSARHSLRPVHFYCRAPQARSVQLAGDFNHWNPLAMQRRDDGWWFIQVMLIHGHHQYRFLVDGKPVLDPRAAGVGRNQSNEEVSIIAVG
jgi:1,4-alpha-glucan branching enzyme